MNPDRLRAAIRMLYPDEMTPTARNVLENILDEEYEAPEAPVNHRGFFVPGGNQ